MVNVDSWWDGLVQGRFRDVTELVLDAMAEDYVTVEIILRNINEWDGRRDEASWPARSAAPVSRPEVVRALGELIREGYAQTCLFNGQAAQVVKIPPGARPDLWFCATAKGISAIRQILGE